MEAGLDIIFPEQLSFGLYLIEFFHSTARSSQLQHKPLFHYANHFPSEKITLPFAQQTYDVQSRRFESPSPLRYRKRAQFLQRSLVLALQWTGNKTQSIYTSLWRYIHICSSMAWYHSDLWGILAKACKVRLYCLELFGWWYCNSIHISHQAVEIHL